MPVGIQSAGKKTLCTARAAVQLAPKDGAVAL
jgi:hypothetical protein